MLVLPFVFVLLTVLFVFYKVESGEDVGAVGGDGHGVLIVGCRLAVAGAAGPAVLLGEQRT